MNKKYAHILTLLDAQITAAKRNINEIKSAGWDDLVPEAEEHLHEWELLYDAVDQGLLDAMKMDFSVLYLAVAGAAA